MSSTTAPLWNRSFILCVLNNLFLFTYYFALIAILPIYITTDLGGTVKEAGLALTLFLVSSIAIRPFSGLIIEKLGKKLAMRGAGLLFALFAFSYLLIDSMSSLLIVRFLHGIWFSILTTVTVPVANDFIPDQRKGEGMGYFVMSTNLGVVFGPLIALTTIQFTSFQMLFGILAVLISLGLIFSLILNIRELPQAKVKTAEKSRLSLQDIIETKVLAVSFVALLTAFAYSSITSFITVFAETKQLLAYVSLFFIVFAFSMLLVRPWVGKFYDNKGPDAVIYPSLIFFALGLVLVTLVNNQWMLWLSAVFIGIGYGSLFPCLQTLAIQAVEKQRMGHAISTFFTLFDLGLAVGSVMMGIFIAHWGYETTYMLCAMIVILTLLVYRYTISKKRTKVAI
ncbi:MULTISPECIES: MFS transporter [Acinetobacter]|uniref:MFS transporter n=1 Tax=Acinetobacter TaxID=469 RepID=UPI0013B07193|nr:MULTISPECIES: MFS transporter [Acinetobacter]MEB5929623.1 MFS transporter [Acinetobacter schindleri]QIC61859.1 MFS transporter [Acinetobacter schindleri]